MIDKDNKLYAKYKARQTMLNCEREDYAALWVGSFASNDQLYEYLDTHYDDEPGFRQGLKKLFVPQNARRPFEGDLRTFFQDFYNQFEYDFGVSFDEVKKRLSGN